MITKRTLLEKFEAVIGLEVHVQLQSRSKIFCSCSARYGASPNTQVCPVCLGHPGVLPVLNREAVTYALRFGLAVGATVQERNVFARKNYFYPDLPKGYQISQYDRPILAGGMLPFRCGGAEREVRLVRAHLEEDAGKSFHPEAGREAATLVDLNRSGVPLLEIVTEPDLRTPEEAHDCMERIRQLVVYLEICDGNMEEGSLRCDANVSVRPRGEEALYPKTEIKNLNSFRNVARALTWEIKRQARILEEDGVLEQATRLWDASEGRTRVMRTKEDEHDYRYFPEPDLLALVIDPEWVKKVRESLPELPWEKETRFAGEYGLSLDDAVVLAGSRALGDYFETAARTSKDAKGTANWVMTEVLHLIKESDSGFEGLRVSPENLGKMVGMIREGTISGKIGKTVFAEMARAGEDPEAIVESKGLLQIDDPALLERVVDEALTQHPEPLQEYIGGKDTTLQFFIGQVMRITGGRANPRTARDAVKKALDERRRAGS
jgi:aspartyl-tRNA(Asn)/glutamyl-tRNA(Gln) amidotransferase subunit B